jgi:hypothetical protein
MTPEAIGQDDSEAAGNENADEKSKAAAAAAKQPLWKKPQKKKAGKKQVNMTCNFRILKSIFNKNSKNHPTLCARNSGNPNSG